MYSRLMYYSTRYVAARIVSIIGLISYLYSVYAFRFGDASWDNLIFAAEIQIPPASGHAPSDVSWDDRIFADEIPCID